MTSEGGNSEFNAHERLIELNEKLIEEVKNLKQLVFDQSEGFAKEVKNMKELEVDRNEKLIDEVNNLKQFVVELYHATTMGHAPPPLPFNLSGVAPTIVHQAHGMSHTIEDPQYSPDFPQYYNASKMVGSSTMCPLAPSSPVASPLASAPQFTVLARSKSLGKEKEKERDSGNWGKREFEQPHSYFQTPQRRHLEQYPPQCFTSPVHRAQPYAPTFSYPQWHAPAPQNKYSIEHNHFNAPPNLPNKKRKNARSCQNAGHRKSRRRGDIRYTQIGESYTSLFEKLQQASLLEPISGNMNPTGKVDRSRCCKFHSGAPGHDTEQCWELKRAIQAMIDNHQIVVVEDETPDVNKNPLPVHDVQNCEGLIGTFLTEEDLKEISIKHLESSIVMSVGSPNASVSDKENQDEFVETISVYSNGNSSK